MILGGQAVMVDAINNGFVSVRARSRDQNALRSVLKMHRCLVARGEDTGAFQCNVHIAPWQSLGIALGCYLDRSVANVDRVAIHGNRAGLATVHGVIAQKVCVGFDRSEVIDGHDLNIRAARLGYGAQDVATDPSKSVDCYFDCHVWSPFQLPAL